LKTKICHDVIRRPGLKQEPRLKYNNSLVVIQAASVQYKLGVYPSQYTSSLIVLTAIKLRVPQFKKVTATNPDIPVYCDQ